jgi:serine protease Do
MPTDLRPPLLRFACPLLLLLSADAGAAEKPRVAANSLAAVHERYRESLVRVDYTQRVRFSTAEPAQEGELTTNGLVVSAEGLVMVSALIYEPFNQVPHGVGVRFPSSISRTEAEIGKARVTFADGTQYAAEHLGRDSVADVAFFRILAEGKSFRPVVFGAAPLPAIGEAVLVLSPLPDPLGPGISVERSEVQAIVSRPARGFMVSTSAADPVGALMTDLEGTPLGMLDALTVPPPETSPRNPLAIISVLRSLTRGVGRAFARPGEDFAKAAVNPPRAARERRGWLGVLMQALSPELAEHLRLPVRSGVVLGYVYRRSPAERAGLAAGDILIELDGAPIAVSKEEDLGAFSEKVLRAGAGAELTLGYLRNGERREARAELAAAPRSVNEAETLKITELDLTVREVTFDYLAAENREPDTQGVVVEKPPVAVRTNPNRLSRGDLLVKVQNRPIEDLASFRAVVEELRQSRPEEVILFVERGRESFFFAVKPDWR